MFDEVTDEELARLADWAEKCELQATPDWKKAYQAIRQGADWIIRRRTIKRHSDLEDTGSNVKVMKQ